MIKKISSKTKARFGVIAGAVMATATSVMADVDLTAVQTAGAGQLEGYAPTVIGFVLVLVVIGAIIKLTKRSA